MPIGGNTMKTCEITECNYFEDENNEYAEKCEDCTENQTSKTPLHIRLYHAEDEKSDC